MFTWALSASDVQILTLEDASSSDVQILTHEELEYGLDRCCAEKHSYCIAIPTSLHFLNC